MATINNNRSNLITDPVRNFRFLVNFQFQDDKLKTAVGDYATMGFTSMSGLNVSTDTIPYREGGYNTTVHQIPGQTTFSPITLQRGVMLGTPQNWKYMRQLFATVQGGAIRDAATNFRCDLEIQVLTHPIPGQVADLTSGVKQPADHVSMRFKVYNAWISSVAYSDLNAGDNAILVEQVTLVHEGFDLNWGTNLSPTGGAAEFTV
jgi:phage tail-like protein